MEPAVSSDEDSEDDILFFNTETENKNENNTDGVSGDAINDPNVAQEGEHAAAALATALTLETLQDMTGQKDLSLVNTLTLQVNSETQGMSDLGILMPGLKELCLDNSFISSFRDLGGRNLRSIEMLWMGQCGLRDLDGIETFRSLSELHVPLNTISDLEPLMFLEKLVVCDLHGNKIRDVDMIDFLAAIPTLKYAKLSGNPLSARTHYRRIIGSRIPGLSVLDDLPFTELETKALTPEEEEMVTEEGLSEVQEQSEVNITPLVLTHAALEDAANNNGPPSSGRYKRPGFNALDGYYSRPLSRGSYGGSRGSDKGISRGSDHGSPLPWSRPGTGEGRDITPDGHTPVFGWRPVTSGGSASGDSQRPSTASWLPRTRSNDNVAQEEEKDDGSDLTYGFNDSLQGNFVNALRARRKEAKAAAAQAKESPRLHTTPPTSIFETKSPELVGRTSTTPDRSSDKLVMSSPIATKAEVIQPTPPRSKPDEHGQRKKKLSVTPHHRKTKQVMTTSQVAQEDSHDAVLVTHQPSSQHFQSSFMQDLASSQVNHSVQEPVQEPPKRKKKQKDVEMTQQTKPKQQTSSSGSIVEGSFKEGYLLKQSPQGNWNKRYFVLVQDYLLYCKRHTDLTQGGKIARILLRGDTSARVNSAPVLSPEEKDQINSKYWQSMWSLDAATRDDWKDNGMKRPRHLLACRNQAEQMDWVNKVRAQLRVKSGGNRSKPQNAW